MAYEILEELGFNEEIRTWYTKDWNKQYEIGQIHTEGTPTLDLGWGEGGRVMKILESSPPKLRLE